MGFEVLTFEDNHKVSLIDKAPKFEISVSETLAIAALTTASKRDFEEKFRKVKEEDKIKEYLEIFSDLIVRGYASLTTTPVAYYNIVSTRVEDLFFTAIPFGSYNVLSQRAVKVRRYLVPKDILNEEIKNIIRKANEFYEFLISKNIPKEIARRIIPLASESHIFAQFPFESVAQAYKEKEIEKLPYAVNKVVEDLVGNLNEPIIVSLIKTPQYNFSIPHFFHERNLNSPLELKVLDEKVFSDLNEIDKQLSPYLEKFKKGNATLKEIWEFQKIISSNAEAYRVKVSFPCSIACYNELKRHRTIHIESEGIYRAIEEAIINEERIFVPKVLNKYKEKYLELTKEMLKTYEKLENEFGKEKAIYILPQNIVVKSVIYLNFNNLFNVFLFARIRSCITAEFEIREKVWNLINLLENSQIGELVKKYLKVGDYPLPKCIIGNCSELSERKCNIINLFLEK